MVVEARDRTGGRMFTVRDPHSGAPVELGAEFIHGKSPHIWDVLHAHGISADEVAGDNWCVEDGQICGCDFFNDAEQILGKMDDRRPDESFLSFLDRCCPEPTDSAKLTKARERAIRYVTGFHAADPREISVHSLVRGNRADEKIEADRAFRMAGGYQSLLDVLQEEIKAAGVPVHVTSVVKQVRWGRNGGELRIDSATLPPKLSARKLLITLPLGVLQARPGEAGFVHFEPELPSEKQNAISRLAMGKVIRVVLSFRERFWDDLHARTSRASKPKSLAGLSFLFSQDEWFPTWWTQMPRRTPLIVGWAPFTSAEKLSGNDQGFITQEAFAGLGRLLGQNPTDLQMLLGASYVHDWETDPFSHGAYSYVKVGGEGAQQQLAAPVDDTLFFAGEATDFGGHHGTVHGAIASGKRAAAKILELAEDNRAAD